jgi:hypothetical protein
MPPFCLRNVFEVLSSPHVQAVESTPRHRAGNARTVPQKPAAGCDPRITQWAAANGKTGGAADFASRLDGPQVGAELVEIFRETPEFGRSLAMRIEPFLDESKHGDLILIGGGGEAIVFGDRERQHVIKLLAPPCKAAFGWVMERGANGRWGIRAGTMAEALMRFAWFEECFQSGEHPDELRLHEWMHAHGWTPWLPPTDLAMIQMQSWRRGEFIATDVRPENALVAESDQGIRPIDFIVARIAA